MSLDDKQKPWLPEREVSEDQALVILQKHFAQKAALSDSLGAIDSVRFLSNGWDNSVLHVHTRKASFTARFPRREIALSLLHHEAALLPFLASKLPLDIPETIALLEPHAAAEWPVLLSNFVEGQTLCRANINALERSRIARVAAQFLRALHRTPLDQAREHGAQDDAHRRTDFTRLGAIAAERVAALIPKGELSPLQGRRFFQLLERASSSAPAPSVLCHGDLYARHLIVAEEKYSLIGVIDWGDVHIGCPSKDLGMIFALCLSDEEALTKALDLYGNVTLSTHHRALACAAYSALMILTFGLDIDDHALVDEGRRVLKALLQ